MISFADFDLFTRGGSLALLALWSWLLIRDHWSALPARIAVGMNISIAAHVFATIPSALERPDAGPLDVAIQLASGTVPGLFWLFARTWFNDETRVGWRSWLLVFTTTAIVAVLIATYRDQGQVFFVAAAMMRVAMFSFAAAGLWIAWRGRDNDLVEARRRIRSRLVVTVGAFVIIVNIAEILVYNDLAPEPVRSLIEVGVFIVTFGLCVAMFGTRQIDIFGPQAGPPNDPVASPPALLTDDPLVARLLAHMDHHKPHRDEGLTIAALAAQLGEQEYRLRRLINGRLGYRNFPAFLNSFRLAEVKAALADREQAQVPILTIALDAGFGSLGPFNRAFREAEGMTPSAWRTAHC